LVAASRQEPIARLWSIPERRTVRTLEGHTVGIEEVSFTPGGELLATAGSDRGVRIWAASTGRTLRILPHEASVHSLDFSPDGTRLVTAGPDGGLGLWDVRRDRRSGNDLDRLVICRVPFHLENGQALPNSVDTTVSTKVACGESYRP
jgi:WD40 repeat protein